MKKIYGFTPVYDEVTAVKYFAFNEDQWVSYDDAQTLQLKVDFAQEQGFVVTLQLISISLTNLNSLLGLFIWSVDLDTKSHDALQALLGGQLDIFAKQNGVHDITDDWQSVSGTKCVWSGAYGIECNILIEADIKDCGSLDCPSGMRSAVAQQWCLENPTLASTQILCCPIANTPDPSTCAWNVGV